MIQWIAIGALIILGFIFLKFEHQGRRIKLVLILLIGLLIYFSVVTLISSSDLDLKSPKGIINAGYVYVGWLGNTFSSLWDIGSETVTTVGHAIKVNQTDADPRK